MWQTEKREGVANRKKEMDPAPETLEKHGVMSVKVGELKAVM